MAIRLTISGNDHFCVTLFTEKNIKILFWYLLGSVLYKHVFIHVKRKIVPCDLDIAQGISYAIIIYLAFSILPIPNQPAAKGTCVQMFYSKIKNHL